VSAGGPGAGTNFTGEPLKPPARRRKSSRHRFAPGWMQPALGLVSTAC